MTSAIDTSVISAIWTAQPGADAVASALEAARAAGSLVVSGVVYAELLAHPGVTSGFVQRFFPLARIEIDCSPEQAIWHEAGLRYRAYAERRRRARSDAPRSLLADFVIGIHALLRAGQLITLNGADFRRDFPELKIIPPGSRPGIIPALSPALSPHRIT